jgi:hypothetical protein
MKPELARMAAFGVAAGVVSVGCVALLAPEKAAELFGMPMKDERDLDWVRAAGARDVSLGALSALAVASKDRRISSAAMFALAVVPIADSMLVSRRQKGGGFQTAMHGSAASCIAALGRMLLEK